MKIITNTRGKIYLTVAGFNILIVFFPVPKREIHDSWINKDLYTQIMSHYSAFIVGGKTRKADFTIHIYQHFPNVTVKQAPGRTVGLLHFFKREGNDIITFQHISINQLNLILLTSIQYLVARSGGFILHASSSLIHNNLYLFCAKSGGGKSTAMKLLHPHFHAFSDDIFIIRKIHRKYYGFQSPIREKNDWIVKTRLCYRVRGIFFLRKAHFYRIVKIVEVSRKISLLTSQLLVTVYHEIKSKRNALQFVQTHNQFYTLYFKKGKKLRSVIDTYEASKHSIPH